MKLACLKISTLSIFILTTFLVQAQEVSNTSEIQRLLDANPNDKSVPIIFNNSIESEKSFRTLNLSDDWYNLNLFSMESELFNFHLKFRLEDELPYENNAYTYIGFFYFDLKLNYSIKAFNFSFGLENLLGLNNPDVSIQPELVGGNGIYNEVIFAYDSAYLINAGVSFNF